MTPDIEIIDTEMDEPQVVMSRVTVRSYDDLPLGEQTVAHVQAKLQVHFLHPSNIHSIHLRNIFAKIPHPGQSGTGNVFVTIRQGAAEMVSAKVKVKVKMAELVFFRKSSASLFHLARIVCQ